MSNLSYTGQKAPKDCSYPKNCGWGGKGCDNLVCKHRSAEAARKAAIFLKKPSATGGEQK